MLFAAVAWIWGLAGPWLWWLWGIVALALDGFLKSCGMVFLFERASRWWKGC